MGKITTSIHLTDGVSPTLRRMQSALTTTIGSFNTVQNTMGAAFNTRPVNAMDSKLLDVNRNMQKVASSGNITAQAIGQATAQQNNLNRAFDKGEQEVGGIDKKLDEIVKCLGTLVTSAKTLISTSSQIAHTTGKVESKLKYANNSHFKLNQTAQRLVGIISQEATGMNRVEQEISQANTAQQRFNNSARSGTGILGGLVGKVTALVGAYAGVQGVKGVIGTADQLTMTNARLNLMNDGLQTTAQLEDKIYQAAMRSRGGFAETADAVAKLGQRAGAIFKNNDETIAFTETLNKMFVIAGASQAEMSSATLQLTQALGSGVLRGEEFNAVFEAAPNVMQAVADYINQPIGKLKELASDGKISAEIVKNALFAATDKVNKQFEKMPYTWAQVWQTIKNYTIKATRPILQAISDITKSERFIRFANGLGNAISFAAGVFKNLWTVAAPILGGIYDMVAWVADCFVSNWSWIAPIVAGVAAAFLVLKTPLMMAAIWTGICTVATKLWAAAQAVFNAVMAANPIVWVVLAVIALVAVFYAAIAAVNKFTGSTLSATGMICGAFNWLGHAIANVFIGIYNIGAGVVQAIVNAWNWCSENIDAVFYNIGVWWDNLWADAYAGLCSFISKALSKLSSLAQKIQPLADLFDIDLSGLANAANNAAANVARATSSKRSYKQTTAFKKVNWESESYFDLGEAYDAGYKWGEDKATQIENFFSGKNFTELGGDDMRSLIEQYGAGNVDKYGNITGQDNGGLNDIGKVLSGQLGNGSNPTLDKIAKNTGETAKNTGKTADNTADLSFMRDMASREAINRFTLTDLKLNISNNNSINSKLDIDDVVERMLSQFYEGAVSTAAKLHY